MSKKQKNNKSIGAGLLKYWPVFLIVIGGFLLFQIIKKFGKNGPGSEEGDSEKEKLSVLETFKRGINEKYLSVTTVQAQFAANALLDAMDGWGTDVKKCFSVLEDKTVSDLELIYYYFGCPFYETWGKGSGLAKFIGAGTNLYLSSWFEEELNDSDYQKMKEVWAGTRVQF